MRNKHYIRVTSEGFSFHTLALNYTRLNSTQFKKLFQVLKIRCSAENKPFYQLEKNHIEGVDCYFCGLFSEHGIKLYLSVVSSSEYVTHVVKAVINPRKLIDPECDYLGIMTTDKKSIDKMEKRLACIMRKVNLPESMNKWSLTRIDLCVNFLFDRKKLPQQIIQLIQRGPVPNDYEKDYFVDSCVNENGKFKAQKHSIRLSNKRISLVAYDKAHQLKKEGLAVLFNSKDHGILRLELRCEKAFIDDQFERYTTTREKIEYFCLRSREYISKYAHKLYLTGEYCRKDELFRRIDAAKGISQKTKSRMKKFVKSLSGCLFTYDHAIKAASKKCSPKQLRTMEETFERLGLAPIPLSEECKLASIYSIPSILDLMEDNPLDISLQMRKRGNYTIPFSIFEDFCL